MRPTTGRVAAVEALLAQGLGHRLHALPDAFSDGGEVIKTLLARGTCDGCVRDIGARLTDDQRAFVLAVLRYAIDLRSAGT